MAKKTKKPAEFSLPWFKFWANRWLGSETVGGMSLAEQGLFVRILCAQRVYGPLPRDAWKLSKMLGIRYEATTRWLHKYSVLTADAEQSSSKFVVPKMEELQSTLCIQIAENNFGAVAPARGSVPTAIPERSPPMNMSGCWEWHDVAERLRFTGLSVNPRITGPTHELR